MNKENQFNRDVEYYLLREIASRSACTQVELAEKIGVSVGKVNYLNAARNFSNSPESLMQQGFPGGCIRKNRESLIFLALEGVRKKITASLQPLSGAQASRPAHYVR